MTQKKKIKQTAVKQPHKNYERDRRLILKLVRRLRKVKNGSRNNT